MKKQIVASPPMRSDGTSELRSNGGRVFRRQMVLGSVTSVADVVRGVVDREEDQQVHHTQVDQHETAAKM